MLALIVLFVCIFTLSTTAMYAAANNSGNAFYHGNTEQKRVSLMINVYWGNEYIDGILEVLEEHNVKTTFFIGGSWAVRYPEILVKISDAGHEIGSHGYLHRNHDKLSYDENIKEIRLAAQAIEGITGKKIELFAPPSGAVGKNMFAACKDMNCKVIMWSKDTVDWRDKDSSIVLKRATQGIKNGDFILAHPTAHTLVALPSILRYYETNGIYACTVSENLS